MTDHTKTISPALLKKFLRIASNSLRGEWVLLGGSVLPALGAGIRQTYDIDVSPMGESTTADQLKLYGIAKELGLSVEAVNMAASYFLKKINGFKKELVVLHAGKTGTFFRPNLKLYLMLKSGRMSEQDYLDCLEMLKLELKKATKKDLKDMVSHLNKKTKTATVPTQERLQKLIARIEKTDFTRLS